MQWSNNKPQSDTFYKQRSFLSLCDDKVNEEK